MAITRFSPSDLGTVVNPGENVASTVQDSFYKARQNMRQDEEAARQAERFPMEKERFDMQKQQFEAGMEDREWSNENIRPLELQQKQLGVAAAGLGMANQSLGLQQANQKIQLDAMRISQEMQTNQMLDSSMEWMKGQATNGDGLASKLPPNLQPLAGDFEAAGNQYGLDPTFLAAVAAHETGMGTSPAFRNKNNAMGVSNASGPIAFSNARESIFQQAKTLAGNLYKGADDISSIGAIYAPPGAGNDPNNDNPSWASGVTGFMRKFGGTPDGPIRRSTLNGGTGVPSLTQTVSAATPNGMPVVAAAAGSLDPNAVIAQTFKPAQQQALAQYDSLAVVAETGQPYQRAKAVMMMRTMESDPRFIEAKVQKEEMVRGVQNQIHANSLMQSAPDDMVDSFGDRYGSTYKLQRTPDGQMMPLNAVTGLPLTSREYPAFANAFKGFSDNYKYDPMAARADDRLYLESVPKFAAVEAFKNVQAPVPPPMPVNADGKPVDPEESKVYAQRVKDYNTEMRAYNTQKNAVDVYKAELAISAYSNKKVKAVYDTLFAKPVEEAVAEESAAVPTAAPVRKTVEAAAALMDNSDNERLKQENMPKWDAAKNEFQQKVTQHFPDTGGDDAAKNKAIQAAAQIYQTDGNHYEIMSKVLGDKKATDMAFEDTARVGTNNVYYSEVAKAWAEDILRKHGYLEGSSPASTPAGRSNIKSIKEIK